MVKYTEILVKSLIFIGVFIFITTCSTKNTYKYPFQNPGLPVEERVNDLVSRLTLDEKVKQMVHGAPAIERLEIPQYNWWNECLHGVGRAGLATVFPQPIGLAAMFDDSSIYVMADVISTEARAKHNEFVRKGERGIYQGLTFWSPNINIFRDPRWGRGMETYGEDPYLTTKNGVAFVKGLQGNNPKYFKVIATAKHFAVHSGPEPIRHSFDAQTDERDFRETYLPAFEELVKDAGVYSVMCAYNRYKGEACCGSDRLLTEILRNEWGFKGYVVSDCWAVTDFVDGHKIVKTTEDAVALAVKSGTDLECGVSYPKLVEAVKKGEITEAEIDIALKRLMTARFKLGMFNPDSMVSYTQIPYSIVDCDKHKEIAEDITRKSIVLLKNQNNLLPLKKDVKKIFVCGPNANDEVVLLGNYNGIPSKVITPIEGIRNKLGNAEVLFEKGCDWVSKTVTTPIPLDLIGIDGQKGFKAEYFSNINLEGNPIFTRFESKVNFNFEGGELAPGVKNGNASVRWTTDLIAPETGEYQFTAKADDGCRFYIDGKKLIDLWEPHKNIAKFISVQLAKGQKYRLVLEYYQKDWSSEMCFEWVLPNNPSFKKAIELASKSDVIVMCGGISPRLEGEQLPTEVEGFYGGDRTSLDLPKVQTEFLKALKATGKPIVLVLVNGSALSINWENENIPAIVEAWYGGQAAGTAIADVLFGYYNPAGRLPVTFYKSVNDLPNFTDYNMNKRTYRYFDKPVLYPFGYGLSYSTFEYQNLVVKPQIKVGEELKVSVQVKNTGKMDGDEVVQLYLKDIEATVPVPIHSLVGFKRVHLRVGETKTVEFTILPKQLSIINDDNQRIIEPGLFKLYVGGNQPTDNSENTGGLLIKVIEVVSN